MPLTSAQVQAAILGRTGDIDPTTGDPVVGGGGYLETRIAALWAQYADKAYVSPRLQELFVERDCYRVQIGLLQDRFTFRDSDAAFNRSERVDRLMKLRDAVQEQIGELVAMAAANRAPAVGPMSTAAPIGAPPGSVLDGNHPRYGGSPYYRRPWGYP